VKAAPLARHTDRAEQRACGVESTARTVRPAGVLLDTAWRRLCHSRSGCLAKSEVASHESVESAVAEHCCQQEQRAGWLALVLLPLLVAVRELPVGD
jgi:hypothetical protein